MENAQTQPTSTYTSRFPEISVPTSQPTATALQLRQPSPTIRQSERERIRSLRVSTITDIVLCVCAISIVAVIIYMVATNKYVTL